MTDEIRRAIATFRQLYPEHDGVTVGMLADELCVGDDGQPAQAFTLFPENGGAPEIWVSDATPTEGIPDTLFHEFAHVVAGIEADHGPVFEVVYQKLWKEFDQ